MLAQLTPSAAPTADRPDIRPRRGVHGPDAWGGAIQIETGAS